MRLYARIYLHLLLVVIGTGVTVATVTSSGWRGEVHRRITERLTRVAATLAAEHFDEPDGRDAFIRHLVKELDVDLTLRDARGTVLVASGRELPPLTDEQTQAVHDGEFVMARGQGYFGAAEVKGRDGALLGYLEAAPRRPPAGPDPWRTVGLVLLVALVIGIGAYPLARRISRPIERLSLAMERFGAGELGYRIALERERHQPNELVNLQIRWNEMTTRVESLMSEQRQLLANVSHELRSPLARIRVALALLPRGAASESRLGEIEGDVAELERLIEAILTTSRLEQNGHLRTGPIEVDVLLAGLLARAKRDPLIAMHEVAADAPSGLALSADLALVERAIWNLLENAAKYGAPPIHIRAQALGTFVTIAVADNGPGIPPEERARVVLPFYRGDKSRTPSEAGAPPQGFGLGLTLAERVARAHGGRLDLAATAQERGLTATLILPVTPRA